jgi:hypothetical protein
MSNLTRTNWPLGWVPNSDAVNGNPDGLLRADNLRIDKLGVTGLRDGDRLLFSSSTYASRFYSKIIEGAEYIWSAYGLPVSSIVRTVGFLSTPTGGISTTAGAGTPGDHAAFGDALGYVFAIAGKLRVKDPVLTAAKPLGLLTPQSIAARGPRLQVNNASTLTFPVATNVIQGTGSVSAVNVDNTTLEGAIGGVTDNATKDTTLIAGGREGRDIGLDIIQFNLTIKGTSPSKVAKVVVDFILDGTPTDPGTYQNYYELTFAADWLPSGEGTQGVISAKRANAVRYGNDQALNWTNVIGFRCYILSTDPTTEADFGLISFKGGPGGLNGVYNYIQVDIADNGKYQAKSPVSPLGFLSTNVNENNITVINGSVTIVPIIRDTNATEHRFFRMSVADVGIDPNTGESLNQSFLGQFYYVGSVFGSLTSNAFVDFLSDTEVLELNADGSFLPNLNLATLNSNDSVNGLQDTIYGIEGLHKDRMIYLTVNDIHISDRLNPDAVDLRFTIVPSGDSTEKNLWIKQLTNDTLILGTTKNLYEISGSFAEQPDGTLDVTVRPIGEAFPPLSIDVCQWKGALLYVAADGLRATSGSNSENLSPQLRELFKPVLAYPNFPAKQVHGVPVAAIFSGVGVDYSIAAAHGKIYFTIPCADNTRRLITYDTVTQTYNLIYADPIVIHATEAGEILASFLHQYTNSGSLTPSGWLIDASPGYGFNGTQGMQFKLRTVFDANGQPRNRKDTFTLKLVLDTGGRDVSVQIQKDGAGVTEIDETSWISLGTVSANGQQTKYIRLDSTQITLGFRYALQLQDAAGQGVFTFKLYEATIEYEPRPEQLNYLRLLPTNLGTVSRKRWTAFAFVIDTLGSNATFTPYLDNVAWATVATFSTGTKLTYIFYFDSEAVATDMGGIIIAAAGACFEFYGVNLEEVVSEKLPSPTTYLLIPGNNYGTPNRKRHTSYKFQINTRGGNVRFTPILDLTSHTPTSYNTSRKQTVDYYFPQSDGDVIGVDIGGVLESTETPKQPFEFYGVVVPQLVETLPDRLEYLRIPNSNFGTADRKRIRTISLVLDTRGQPVVFTPFVDNLPYSVTSSFTTNGKTTVWYYFNSDIVGVDFGGVLSTGTGTPFEFYSLGTPDNVEPLPLPVTLYIIPPNNYGTPNRKRHTSYKWQMITRGAQVRFTPIVDRVEYTPAVFQTDKKQLCEYFFPQRPPVRFDDYAGGDDVIGIDIGGRLESIDGVTPFEFYEVVVPQKIEVLPDRLQYLRIPNTNFGVAARKRVRTIPIIIDTYGNLVRYTPIVDDVLFPPSFWRTHSKTTVHHFFAQDIFGTDFGGILSCEGGSDSVPITPVQLVGLTYLLSDSLVLSEGFAFGGSGGARIAVSDMLIIQALVSFTFTEDVATIVDPSVEDTLLINDAVSLLLNAVNIVSAIGVQIVDGISLAELFARTRFDANAFAPADTLVFADTASRVISGTAVADATVLVSNALVLTDAVARGIASRTIISITDSFSFSDNARFSTTGSVADNTAEIQALIDSTPDGGTVTIVGTKGINPNGLRVASRTNLTIRGDATLGGTLQYIGADQTVLAYSSMLYMPNCSGCTLFNIAFEMSNKPAEGIFVEAGSNNVLDNLRVRNIAYKDNNPPFAGIHSARGFNLIIKNCTVNNTDGIPSGNAAVRGIWCGQGETEKETNVTILNCTTSDTGHTGIVVEASGATIMNCTARNVFLNGTGFKMIPRGADAPLVFSGNFADNCPIGAGIMYEGGAFVSNVFCNNNRFRLCGQIPNTFGGIYLNGLSTSNFQFNNNSLDQCRSIGALLFTGNATLSNSTFLNGSSRTLALEQTVNNVFLTNSGRVDVGTNIHNVVVDGIQIVPAIVAATITPSGGDDTALLQAALNSLSDGTALYISGVLRIANTVLLDAATNREIRVSSSGSGMIATSSSAPTGGNSALLWIRNCVGCIVDGLEFNLNNKPAGAIYVDGGSDNGIHNNNCHDISLGGASSAISSGRGTNLSVTGNIVSNTAGIVDADGVRGIFLGAGNDYETNPTIIGNTVTNVGHTGIACEGTAVLMSDNIITGAITNGSGMKVVPRGASQLIFVENNIVTNAGGGLSIESVTIVPAFYVRNNTFTSCGPIATTFGALYVSGGLMQNLHFDENTIDDCRSLGALRFAEIAHFNNNTFLTGSNVLHLETDDAHIFLINSGTVDVGTNVSDVVVDGVQVVP